MNLSKILTFVLVIQINLFGNWLHSEDEKGGNGITLDAEKPLTYDEENGKVTAEGNAVLRGEDFILQSDLIEWNRKLEIVSASGKVILSFSGKRVLADKITLDMNTGSFTADKVKLGHFPWYVEADSLTVESYTYSLLNASLKHENHESFSPNLLIGELSFDDNQSLIEAESIGFKIGNSLVGKIPRLRKKAGDFKTRYEILGGKQKPLGWYGGVRTSIFKSEKLVIESKFLGYPQRGFYLSPIINFQTAPVDEFPFFHFQSSFGGIHDHGDTETDFRSKPIPADRGYARIQAKAHIEDNWKLNLKMNPQTDSDIFRDFERDRFEKFQWVENFAELSYDRDWLSASFLSDWQENDYEEQVEEIPKLSLLVGPKSFVNGRFLETIQLDYSSRTARDNNGVVLNEYESTSVSMKSQGVFSIGRGISYLPAISYKRQDYHLDSNRNPYREFLELSNALKYSIVGSPQIEFLRQKDNLMHFSSFTLSHNHNTMLNSRNTSAIPILRGNYIDPGFEKVDLFDFSDYDDLDSYEIIRIGWENELFGDEEQNRFRKLASLNLEQDIWVDSGSDFWSEPIFSGRLEINPFDSLGFSYGKKINTSNGKSEAESFSIKIRDGIMNEFSLSSTSIPIAGSNFIFISRNRINYDADIEFILRYNPRLKSLSYWSGSIRFKRPVGWDWKLFLSGYEGTRKEDHINLGFKVNVFSF